MIWYVGQTIDQGRDVAVMFEINGPTGRQLVVGQATASDVMKDQAAWSRCHQPVGAHRGSGTRSSQGSARYRRLRSRQPPGFPGQNPDNWLVLLTAPDVRRVSWYETTTGGPRRLSMPTSAGLAITDIGPVTGDVELTGLTTSRGTATLDHVRVAIGGRVQVPELAPPAALSLPRSFSDVFGGSGQGSETNLYSSFHAGRLGYAVYGICYGPAPIRVEINHHSIGSIACDSQTHELSVPAADLRGHGQGLWLSFAASTLDASNLEFGTIR